TDQNAEHENDCEQGGAGESRTHQQKFAHEDTERWQAGDGYHASHEAPAEHGVRLGEAAHVGDALRALDLCDMPDGEEYRRLGERMHSHVQQTGEIREWAADAESK